jgi:hypothetical protein
MCRVLRGECSPQHVATHQDRAATRPVRTAVGGSAVTVARADTAEAVMAPHEDTAEVTTARSRAVTARPRVATARLAITADRLTVAVRRGDIVAEATPRRRRTAQARSAAVADTQGHTGASEATAARAVRMVVAAAMVGAVRTAAIAN